MKILEEFYYGNVDPHERDVGKDSEFAQAAALSIRNEETLMKTLTEQQKEQFEKCMTVHAEMNDIGEREAFIRGFKIRRRRLFSSLTLSSSPLALVIYVASLSPRNTRFRGDPVCLRKFADANENFIIKRRARGSFPRLTKFFLADCTRKK